MFTKIRFVAPLVALLCTVSALHAQRNGVFPPINPRIIKSPAKPKAIEGLEVILKVDGPAVVDRQAAQRLKAHQAFLEANKAWEEQAEQVLAELRKEEFGLFSGIGFRGLRQFPQQVIDRMPPRPEYVEPPAATPLNWSITLHNVSDQPIDINRSVWSDMASIGVTVSGPGAFRIAFGPRITTMEIRSGAAETLQPGGERTIKLQRLTYGRRMLAGDWSITEPGTYELTVRYHCRGSFRGGGSFATGKTTFEAELAE